jgi:hypothetical protein
VGGALVGVDFGTSTTLVAARTGGGQARCIPIGRTTPWLPSVAALDSSGRLVFGEDAVLEPLERQIRSIKTTFSMGVRTVRVAGVDVDVQDVMLGLMREALGRAEREVPGLRDGARFFVGCPALWAGEERRLLADVAHEVGLDVDVADIIDEPVAAGLYAVNASLFRGQRPIRGKTVVFDAGGGTLDVAYIDAADGDRPDFTVLSAEGVRESGDSVDASIIADLTPQIDGLDPADVARLLLGRRATEMKEALSFDERRAVPLGAPFQTVLEYTRRELEDRFAGQLVRAIGLVRSAVRGAELRALQMLSPTDIRREDWPKVAATIRQVILVGGLSQMPIVRRQLMGEFPNADVAVLDRPQESVALGLSMGDELDRLNLPRPPVDFVIEYPKALIRSLKLERWAEENRYLYRAYTPLYSPDQVLRGETMLGHHRPILQPPGYMSEVECIIRCETPNRARTRLNFKFAGRSEVANGIVVKVGGRHASTFKLYTNGDLVVNGSRQQIKCRISNWPRLRGARHDFVREVEIESPSTDGWGSNLRQDDWRFN